MCSFSALINYIYMIIVAATPLRIMDSQWFSTVASYFSFKENNMDTHVSSCFISWIHPLGDQVSKRQSRRLQLHCQISKVHSCGVLNGNSYVLHCSSTMNIFWSFAVAVQVYLDTICHIWTGNSSVNTIDRCILYTIYTWSYIYNVCLWS